MAADITLSKSILQSFIRGELDDLDKTTPVEEFGSNRIGKIQSHS